MTSDNDDSSTLPPGEHWEQLRSKYSETPQEQERQMRARLRLRAYHLSVAHAPMKRWQGDVILQAPLQAAQSPGEPGY